jgi:hypothetical protein
MLLLGRMADDDTILRWELAHLAKHDVLDDGEIICELQEVSTDAGPAAFVITDLRILVVRTSVLRHRTSTFALPLQSINEVQSSESRLSGILGRNRGSILIGGSDEQGVYRSIILERIAGGRARAEELARTIERQRDYLARRPPADAAELSDAPEPSDEAALEIVVGRGVAEYVNAHGGELFVWSNPVGAFAWVKVALQRPEDIEFARFSDVPDFELLVEHSLLQVRWRLKLYRRPWPFLDRIAVDTGLSLGG